MLNWEDENNMTDDVQNIAKLTLNGTTYDLPVMSPTAGPDVVDIRKLYAQANVFTYDPGFTSTAACDSTITFIDGEAGVLLHRGYPIDQLASQSHYLEVCFLLLNGHLPNATELEEFESLVTNHTMLHEQMVNFFRGFRRDAHPMAIMTGVVGAMSAFYHDSTDITDQHQREVASIRLIAKMPTIAAMAYKYTVGQPFVYPRNDVDYASNFLRMCFAVPAEDYEVNPILSARWTGYSPYMQITNKMPRPLRFGWRPPLGPIHLPVLQLELPVCGVRHMAVQTKLAWKCSMKSARSTAFQSLSPAPKTKTIPSV